jgi:cytochrome c556
MSRKLVTAVAAIFAASAISFSAFAEPSAEDAQQYRVSIMTTLKGHIGAASMIVRGIIADDGHLLAHAEGLKNGVAELHRVFQAGSNVGESEALPVIWEQPEKFAAALEKSRLATAEFAKVVADGGDMAAAGAAFRNVGMSCRGCHDDFRVAH